MQSKKPGIWQIKATVTLSSGVSLQSNAINIEVQYPDVNKIKSNSTVSSNMSSVWTQTKNAASVSGRQLKPAYNLQIATANQFITHYDALLINSCPDI
jgi:hypothetical protein